MPLSIVHLSSILQSSPFKSLRYPGTSIVRHLIEQRNYHDLQGFHPHPNLPPSRGKGFAHGLVLDGVSHTGAEGAPVFHPAPALTNEELQALLDKIITRILRLLTRERHLVEEEGVTYVADAHGILDPDNLLAPL